LRGTSSLCPSMNRKELFVVATSTFKEIGKDDIGLLAAGLTYYAFLGLFPLLLAAITLVSLFLTPEDAAKLIYFVVERVAPGGVDLIAQALADALSNRTSAGIVALVGLGILIYSASNAFSILDRAINRAWGTETAPSFVANRIASFVMMLFIAVLFLVFLVISTLLTWARAITTDLVGEVPGDQIFWQLVNVGVSFGLAFVVLLLLYWLAPRANVTARDAWLAALLAAIAWVVVKEGYALFLGSQFSNFNAVYGTMATVIALLTWIDISSMIILGGAEFAAETQRVRKMRAELQASQERYGEGKSPWF